MDIKQTNNKLRIDMELIEENAKSSEHDSSSSEASPRSSDVSSNEDVPTQVPIRIMLENNIRKQKSTRISVLDIFSGKRASQKNSIIFKAVTPQNSKSDFWEEEIIISKRMICNLVPVGLSILKQESHNRSRNTTQFSIDQTPSKRLFSPTNSQAPQKHMTFGQTVEKVMQGTIFQRFAKAKNKTELIQPQNHSSESEEKEKEDFQKEIKTRAQRAITLDIQNSTNNQGKNQISPLQTQNIVRQRSNTDSYQICLKDGLSQEDKVDQQKNSEKENNKNILSFYQKNKDLLKKCKQKILNKLKILVIEIHNPIFGKNDSQDFEELSENIQEKAKVICIGTLGLALLLLVFFIISYTVVSTRKN